MKKSREKRKKVSENVKHTIEDKVYFATLKKEKIEEAKKIVESENKRINDKGFKGFKKLMDVDDKDLFNVGYYIKNKRSARKSVDDASERSPYEFSNNNSATKKRKNSPTSKSRSIHYDTLNDLSKQ